MFELMKILAIIIGGVIVIFVLVIFLSLRIKDRTWEKAIEEEEEKRRRKKY